MQFRFSLDEIDKAADFIHQHLGKSTVMTFTGEMGAGKTTLIQAFCRRLGVKDTMSSPTFSIINEYKTADGEKVYHMDLYRLKDEEEAINAGVEDSLLGGSLCLVEWPAIAENFLDEATIRLHLKLLPGNKRLLEIL